jgi:5-methylcytosine-specific restriction endonuclease McrBC GTP-binding regulatory subunit McrB
MRRDGLGVLQSFPRGTFIRGKIIDSILSAKNNPNQLTIALLDEMNLAPVEHYFSDFLSVAESRERRDGHISSAPLPIDLPAAPDESFKSICTDLKDIELPHNMRIVGTANMDETTHSFSPKVLDRAFTIEFDDPDLTAFAKGGGDASVSFEGLAQAVINLGNAINISEAQAKSQDMFEQVASWLEEIQSILAPANIKFGYRTRDAILLYLHFWREFKLSDVLADCAALDFCILQKILPKISGSGDALEASLKNLIKWLDERSVPQDGAVGIKTEFAGPLERSREKVERMLALLNLDGTTRYWGA